MGQVWQVPLCLATAWLLEAKVHLIAYVVEMVSDKEHGRQEIYDQAAILGWMHKHDISLGWLSSHSGVSKTMLSYVLNGKKKLSHKSFIALLTAYGSWAKEHGCPAQGER